MSPKSLAPWTIRTAVVTEVTHGRDGVTRAARVAMASVGEKSEARSSTSPWAQRSTAISRRVCEG